MDQTFDARFQFYEGAVVGYVRNPSGKFGFFWIFGFDALPGVFQKLFHSQADSLGFRINPQDLHFQGFANI